MPERSSSIENLLWSSFFHRPSFHSVNLSFDPETFTTTEILDMWLVIEIQQKLLKIFGNLFVSLKFVFSYLLHKKATHDNSI